MSLTDLAKSYEPKDEEPRVRERWEKAHPFHVDPLAPGEPYCIVIPPPNVTASLHLGHALNNTLQDILIRYHRMRGYKTLWMPGTDHAGIATQTVVDKRLQEQGEPALKDFKRMEAAGENGRERFIEKVQAWKDEYEADITDQLKLMGCSCDWDRQRFTMDEVCARAVREAFFQLFKDGLIYRGKRLVNWDPVTQTALADDEVEMEEIDGHFWYLKYPIVQRADGASEETHGLQSVGFRETGEFVTVATTRPETMLGDTAVAVNPNDTKRAHLAGGFVRLPIVNRVVPIIADEYVVLPDPDSSDAKAKYASGYLKVTPAHDPNDWEIGQRHDLAVINVMAPDGSISREHGWREVEPDLNSDEELDNIIGMDRFEAREAVVEYFRRNNLLAEVKPYQHSVGHSYRSHVPIEPYLSDQWYVRVTDDRLRGNALRAMAEDQRTIGDNSSSSPLRGRPGGGDLPDGTTAAESTAKHGTNAPPSPDPSLQGRGEEEEAWHGVLRFYPERYAKTFQTWHENLRDWCISRQLWWGHRIPVWRSTPFTVSPEQRHQEEVSATHDPNEPVWIEDWPYAECAMQQFYDSSTGDVTWFTCPPPGRPDIEEALEANGDVQDPDVLDTWFSSALWPMSTMGWPDPGAFPDDIPEGDALLKAFNPSNVLTTAREIITLWVSRMVMFNTYFLNRLPFHDVFIHAMIQDGEGRKMSKSLGNGVDPRDIIKSKGTDAMRFTLAQMTTQTQDVRMPVEFDPDLGANTSPKFEMGRRFCNKLWNAARYAITTLSKVEGEGDPEQAPAQLIDQWILVKLWVCEKSIERNLSPSREDREANDWEPYRFNAYADALYRFVWGDFCDWYLEGTKRTIYTDPVQQSILRATISCIIRWLHPVMPFITESLFDAVEELKVRPHHALNGLDGPNALGIAATASWPTIDISYIGGRATRSNVVSRFEDVKNKIEEKVNRLDTIVSAIREVRSNQNVPDRQRVTFHVGDDDTWTLVKEAEGVTGSLAGLGGITRDPAPAGAVPLTVGGVEHALSNLAEAVDTKAEEERLTRRKAELEKQIGNLKGRLANKNYVDKAPAHLVEETRSQLAEAERELAGLRDSLARLG